MSIPKSPYNLLQELYYPDSWKIMVCCMFLNQTNRKQVDKIRDIFFEKYPSALKTSTADSSIMSIMLQPLGFQNRRTNNIIKMSRAFLEGSWKKPSDLPGVGKYAEDSYKIFMNHDLTVEPNDKILNKYMEWRLEFEKNKI